MQVRRQRRAFSPAVSAPEGLPGEVIVLHLKIAGELFQPAPQHFGHAFIAGEVFELRGRNAEAEQRSGLIGQPADEFLLEHRSKLALEHLTLFLQRLRFEHPAKVDLVQLGKNVGEADEIAQQSLFVDAFGEVRNPLAPAQVALFPIGAAERIEVRGDHGFVDRAVFLVIGMREKAVKAFVIGQVLDRGNLELAQGDMRLVEINRGHAFGIGGEVGQRVAAAAGDAHHPAIGLNVEPFHVDHRVFPDLGIDEAFEGERKRLVEQLVAKPCFFADHGVFDDPLCLCCHFGGVLCHVRRVSYLESVSAM